MASSADGMHDRPAEPMTETPSEAALRWAAAAVGAGAAVLAVHSLHGGAGPWLLRIEHRGTTREVVLRVAGRVSTFHIPTGAAALRVAEQHGLAAPRLVASDLDGRVTGAPATLETAVPGSSASPRRVSAQRLRTIGAAIARVHKVPLDPRPDLPFKVHSLQGPNEEEDSIPHLVRDAVSTPILRLAGDRLKEIPTPKGRTVFLHADLWAGNMLWDGDANVVLIDWKDAGVGDPGVDLGHLRMKMAVQYGPEAATHVLDGWRRESGREATNLAYWDAVAAFHTPAYLDDWEPGFDARGNRLTSAAVTGRRDAFLRGALERLDREGVTHGSPAGDQP